MSKSQSRGGPLVTLALAASLAACAGSAAAGELRDLGTVESFKARFNRDAGRPRLLLLLSPT
jgi:hypothetical protein